MKWFNKKTKVRLCQATPQPQGCLKEAQKGDFLCSYCRNLVESCLA